MKLKYTETTEHEKEITLPYYSKYGSTYYKVVSENKTITVNDYEFDRGIQSSNHYGTLPFSVKSIPITQAEFNDVYNKVLEFIQTLNH